MPRLILNPGTASARVLELKAGLNRIGRKSEGNDFSIPDLSISGYHCVIQVGAGEVTIEDLGSTNGTYVEGAPIRRATLREGQTVHLGNVLVMYSEEVGAGIRIQIPAGALPGHNPQTQAPSGSILSSPPLAPGSYAAGGRLDIPMPPPPSAGSGAGTSTRSAVENRSTVSLPALDAGSNRCKSHPKTTARYQCPQCRHYFCSLCVVTRPGRGATKYCRHCAVPCIPLRVDKPKAEDRRTGFFGSLPDATVYPFRGNGTLILVGATILFSVLDAMSIPLLGLLVTVFATGYLFSYMQNIIHSTVAGDNEMPDFPDTSGLITSFLQFLGAMVISFTPAILLALARSQSSAVPQWLVTAGLVFGSLYYPMAFLAVSMKGTLLATNPLFVIPSILAVPLQYLVAALLMLGVFAARDAGSGILSDMTFQEMMGGSISRMLGVFAVRMVWAFLGMYLLTVSMRVLGLLYAANKERLGWFETKSP